MSFIIPHILRNIKMQQEVPSVIHTLTGCMELSAAFSVFRKEIFILLFLRCFSQNYLHVLPGILSVILRNVNGQGNRFSCRIISQLLF